jgi:cell fate (sporulation/competence/biofilm development) regulator YlbF (YheA/YmcA/DUF963 family)
MDVEVIIKKSEELADLIENHEIYKKYADLLTKLKNDSVASELHAKLIALGQELSDKANSGADPQADHTAENALLKDQLEGNQLIKDFLQAQKVYVNFIKLVQEKISNPD